MKNFASLFSFIIFGIGSSWLCLIVAGSGTLSFSNLQPSVMDPNDPDKKAVLVSTSEGLAAAGAEVYREMACAACHTQQVRRPGYGGDFDRDWGGRQAVAPDFVFQDNVLLGSRRIGPDLSNVGARRDADWLFLHLYKPSINAEATTMPAYPQLFREKEFSGTPATNALNLEGNDLPPEGTEVVPTEKAVALVAYLQSLNLDYDLPESKRLK